MKLSPRGKLVLIAAGFALPLVASFIAYRFLSPEATANYGELLLPPGVITRQPLRSASGESWSFAQLKGRWILTASDSGACGPACTEKLAQLRQVHLALGRDASRVARVFVIDDFAPAKLSDPRALDGAIVAATPAGMQLPAGAGNDRAHIYLVDPKGNVMMRWPAAFDRRRMLKDLDRLLKASQIG